jgi:hypothetical protein
MGILQDQMDKLIEESPKLILSRLIKEKFAAKSITLSQAQLDQLVARVLDQNTMSANIVIEADRLDGTLAITITNNDIDEINRRSDKLIESLSGIVDRAANEFSSNIFANLKERWPEESRQQRRDISAFRKRLFDRWGEGLNGIGMFVTIAREFGDNFLREIRGANRQVHQANLDVIIRLHARACQVADEVICLLSNGFSDGAIARWRTLHEIAIVSLFISGHEDDLAERYTAHEIVETAKVVREYEKHWRRLGLEAITEDEVHKIKRRYDAAIGKYGPDFKNQYGWAAKHLNKSKPTIADIREGSQIDHLAPFYRLASHNVHANAKGIFFKLGLIDQSEILLSGPSNAGLADPGHATAQSLLQVSIALLTLNPNIDNIVAIRIMDKLTDEIGASLLAAHNTLLAEMRPRKV